MKKTCEAILALNAGSSSLKWALFEKETCALRHYGSIDHLKDRPELKIYDTDGNLRSAQTIHYGKEHYESIFCLLLSVLEAQEWDIHVSAVGHRLMHGGRLFQKPIKITSSVLKQLQSLTPLAPMHMPNQIEDIQAIEQFTPDIIQVACFDTEFHQTQKDIVRLFGLPQMFSNEGILRYGFHGLSYESIVQALPRTTDKADGRVIIAHLGNGASICAVSGGKSVASTAGFSVLDGPIMGTRCGQIDPGVILYLIEEKGLTVGQVHQLLYEKSGLLGISGISYDVEVLEKSTEPNARAALDLFSYRAACDIAALLPALDGLDVLVFTAGIGTHSALIRQKIAAHLSWLGIALDHERNHAGERRISTGSSSVDVLVIPTNEEQVLAKKTRQVLEHFF